MKAIIQVLNQKMSNLRFFVYLLVAFALILTSTVVVLLNSLNYYEPADTFYSKAPGQPKSFLYVSPKEGRYSVGDEFTVDVLVNTAGSDVVATAAYLSFNKSAMQAVSIDTSDSAFIMDAEKEVNNEQGKIKITIGKPTPGVRDNAAKVATIHFKALEKTNPILENISFDFTKGSSLYSTIIIDDKKGTNILSTTQGSKIFIN
ncbi:MAG: cohesin domain-containing protein [Candidatus Paceibacterota bacterium]|jgi:hypothetical protein